MKQPRTLRLEQLILASWSPHEQQAQSTLDTQEADVWSPSSTQHKAEYEQLKAQVLHFKSQLLLHVKEETKEKRIDIKQIVEGR